MSKQKNQNFKTILEITYQQKQVTLQISRQRQEKSDKTEHWLRQSHL